MATVASGASKNITLAAGQRLWIEPTGAGVAVLSGGQQAGLSYDIGKSLQSIGPFPNAQAISITATTMAVDYYITSIAAPGVMPAPTVHQASDTLGLRLVSGIGSPSEVKTLTVEAVVSSAIMDQLPDGKYVGTSGDAAGGFGGQLWTATGSASALVKTAISASNTSALKDTTGASIVGGTIQDAWALPDGNLVFGVIDSAAKYHLYFALNTAGTWTVGSNSTTYNNQQAVLDAGLKGGVQPANIRSLHNRSLCVANISGSTVLLFGEYNVASGRVAGSTNDQVRVWRSTDGGKTWSILIDWNGNGSTSQVRHVHGIVQDPITKMIYIMVGDDPTSGIIQWNGVSAAPAANTSISGFNALTGWAALWNATNPDLYRSGDLLFGGEVGAYLTDRSVGAPGVDAFWPATAISRTGRMSAVKGRPADMTARRDPLIGIAIPGGGGFWLSMFDTSLGTRGYDVWASPDMRTWFLVGSLSDYGTGAVGVLQNVFWSQTENKLIVNQRPGGSTLVAGQNAGSSAICNADGFWSGTSGILS